MTEVAELEARYPELERILPQARAAINRDPDCYPAFAFTRGEKALLGVTCPYPHDPLDQAALQIALGTCGRALRADTILWVSNCLTLAAKPGEAEAVQRGEAEIPVVEDNPEASPALMVTVISPGHVEHDALMYPYRRNDDGTVTWAEPNVVEVSAQGFEYPDSALAFSFGQADEPIPPAWASLMSASDITGRMAAFALSPEVNDQLTPPAEVLAGDEHENGVLHGHDQN